MDGHIIEQLYIYSCRGRNNQTKAGLFLDPRYRTQGSTVRILSRIVQELAFDDGTGEMSIYITLRGCATTRIRSDSDLS